jgi:hypothetical protein
MGIANFISMGPSVVFVLSLVRPLSLISGASGIGLRSWPWHNQVTADKTLDLVILIFVPGVVVSQLDLDGRNGISQACYSFAVSCCGCGDIDQCSRYVAGEIQAIVLSPTYWHNQCGTNKRERRTS